VAVKIKLKRLGKIRAPYYRIVVADSRTKRDGRAIEEIGKYHPKSEPSLIEVDSERAQHWLKVGAQPTDPVRKILEVTGDWQKFKGLPGAEGTLRVAEPKADKKAVFAAAAAESLVDSGAKTKPKAKAADAKADKPARAEKADKPEKADKAEKAERPARAKKAAEPAAPAAAEVTAEPVPAETTAEPAAAEPAAAEVTPAEASAEEAVAAETAAAKESAQATVAADADAPSEASTAEASTDAESAGSEA
jgi:small subunit ribosomal protein S16